MVNLNFYKNIITVHFILIFIKVALTSAVCKDEDFRFGQWVPGASECGLLDVYVSRIQWSDHQRIQQEFYENKVGRDTDLHKPFHWSKW